jgi:hypothetical protein
MYKSQKSNHETIIQRNMRKSMYVCGVSVKKYIFS